MTKQTTKQVVTALSALSLTAMSCLAPAWAHGETAIASATPSAGAQLFKVSVEHGKRQLDSGTTRAYTLYIPEGGANEPHPMVVLLHGFLMTDKQHSGNSKYFTEHGFIVYCPDMTKILLGDKNRTENVNDVLDQIVWLTKQSEDPKSPLYKKIDPERVGIAGNSAGGAVCFELLLEAQKRHVPIRAMCSLDGVPWDRTKEHVADLQPTKILSLRAEPALCNYHARVLQYLELLKFPCDDVKINGSHHCDVENPTSLGCRCVCGRTDDKYRIVFERLTYLFFKDALGLQSPIPHEETFVDAVKRLQSNGMAVAHLNMHQSSQIATLGNQQHTLEKSENASATN